MSADIDIETILPWGPGRRVNTRYGPRIVHNANPTAEFWDRWRSDEKALRKKGVSVNRHYRTGEFQVTWWKDIPKKEKEFIHRTIEESRKVDADIDIPKPDNGMDYYGYQRAGIAFALRVFGYIQ